jgi:choline dehydrogenase-like flavoprotein
LILRGNQLEQRKLDADIVVVGAGPAGLAVAWRLSKADGRVLVLDSGGLDPQVDSDAANGRTLGPLPYFDLAQCRPRGLGGSTGLWGGWCEALDDLDFQARPGFVETGWCFTREDLEPYYRVARSFCGIPDATSSRPWRWADAPIVRDSPFYVRSFPVLGPRQLGRRHANLFNGERIDLVLDATAVRIATNADGTSVDHIAIQTPGGSLEVSGGLFVLAVGGIETARLLLASVSAAWPDGLGNANDLVGRFFMDHPHVDAMRLCADVKVMDTEFFLERTAGLTVDGEPMAAAGALVLSDEVCTAERIGRIQLFIEPAGGHTKHPLSRVWRDRPFQPAQQAPGNDTLAVITSSEQVPNRCSRVVLGGTKDRYGVPLPLLDWELANVDHRTVRVGTDLIENLILALGAKNIQKRIRHELWPLDTLGSPHHLGTARMAHSSAHGVVDPDCRVHGVRNLFLAGGAVFPTSGYAPPTLTIVALALRLGDYLMDAGYLTPPAGMLLP